MSQNLDLNQIAISFGRTKHWLEAIQHRWQTDDFPDPVDYRPHRNGKKALYRLEDVRAWMERHGIDPNVARAKSVRQQPVNYHHDPFENPERAAKKFKQANEKFLAALAAEKRE